MRDREPSADRHRLRRGVQVLGGGSIVLLVLVAIWLGWALQVYPAEYVRRVLVYRISELNDYLEHFPHRRLFASSNPYHFAEAPDAPRVEEALKSAFGMADPTAFLVGTELRLSS